MTRSQKELIGSLVKNHWDKLAQHAYRKTGDRELSKDLAQEVMLVACAKVHVLEKHHHPVAWCYTTLNNLVMSCCITLNVYANIPTYKQL